MKIKKKIAGKYERLNTGVTGLDEMFYGGLIKSTITLIAGHAGVDKTSFGLQFLKEGLEANENCVYISLNEQPERVLSFNKHLEIDWETHINRERLTLLYVGASKTGNVNTVVQKILTNNVDRLVLEGLNFAGTAAQNKLPVKLSEVLNKIKEKKITALITTNAIDSNNYFGLENNMLLELVDNLIVVKQIEVENSIFKVMAILKARGTLYDTKIMELEQNRNGLRINGPVEGYKNIFSDFPETSEIGLQMYFGGMEDYFIEKFNEKYPNTKVYKMEVGKTMLSNELAVKDPNTSVSLSYLFYSQIFKLANAGLLMELEESADNKDMFFEAAISACRVNGKLYGVPDDIHCRCLMYRKDLLEKYGLKVPETWEELIETAKLILLKEKNPELIGFMYPCSNGANLSDVFMEFLWGMGGELTDKDGNISPQNNKIEESLKLMYDLIYTHKLMPENIAVYPDSYRANKFKEGKSVFVIDLPEVMRDINKSNASIKQKVWLAPLPVLNKNCKSYVVLRGCGVVIPKKTKYPAAANKFLKFYSDIEIAKKAELTEGYPFPSRLPFLKDKKILRQKPYYREAENLLKYCRNPYQEIKNYDIISMFIYKNVFKYLSGKENLEETKILLANDINKIKRHKKYMKVVENVMYYMEINYKRQITLEEISNVIRLNRDYLNRIFKFETGMTLFDYLIQVRIEKSKELLKDVRFNIKEVASKVGYSDISYFCKLFKKHTGVTPTEYRFNI
ncbi:MAG: hypothetical protein A2231_05655 [Candidatus Firestonebacteria bacterium RIFOXYA2_FULL_40_8]|nr:MAG: hypothetical protein A2231_05655 [Candidatus Firestonebacteria bacterium RIFOXYA2_FULL_40_8]